MKVLILGAAGYLGPHVVRALEGRHELRLTDVKESAEGRHEYRRVDVADLEQVIDAAEGMDAIINLSVLRHHRRLAFDVNTRGAYNALAAACRHGIRRFIQTGPFYAITGPATCEPYDFAMHPDVTPRPGTHLYALTKGLAEEVCRIFTRNHDLHVTSFLFYHFRDTRPRPDDEPTFVPFTVTWQDAAALFPLALDIPLEQLPSRYEAYFVSADFPHGQFSNEKVKRVFGWRPTFGFEDFWQR